MNTETEVKERPIFFNGPMVKAILAGRKTVTRRIVKLNQFGPSDTPGYDWHFRDKRAMWNDYRNSELAKICPHGQPGDRLWVRETWAVSNIYDNTKPSMICSDLLSEQPERKPTKVKYPVTDSISNGIRLRPSIFMPRWASRITMEVTDVRVEQLKQISPTEIQKEGFEIDNRTIAEGGVCLIEQFARLWEKLNGKGSWELNPWVWVVNFRVI